MKKTDVRSVARMGMLFALALSLSFLEGLIPPVIPSVPGIKLGLSNLVTMYCLFELGLAPAMVITLLKALFVLFVRGTMGALLSLSGGMLSVLAMYCLHHFPYRRFSLFFLSVMGSVSHNLGQILVAMLMLETPQIAFYLPILMISGVAAGAIIGVIGSLITARLKNKISML